MENKYGTKEKLVILGAAICFLAMLYLLYDDSILDSFNDNRQNNIGSVEPTSNDVRYKQGNNFQWKSIRRNHTLSWGDGVFTGSKSQAKVRLKNGNEVTLQENSLIVFTPDMEDMTLDLKFGSVKSQINADGMRIKINGEVVNITGKDAVVELNKEDGKNVGVKVISGKIEIADQKKQVKRFIAGEVVAVDRKGEAKKPKKAAPAPAPVAITKPKPVLNPTLEWDKIKNLPSYTLTADENSGGVEKSKITLNWLDKTTYEAGKELPVYQLEISRDASFAETIVKTETSEKIMSFDATAPGFYFARLQATYEGRTTPWTSISETTVKERAKVMTLAAPKLKRRTTKIDATQSKETELKTTVEWTPVTDAKNYSIEFSRTENFEQILEQKDLPSTEISFQPTAPGTVYYRVRAKSKDDIAGPPSQVGKIETQDGKPVLSTVETKVNASENLAEQSMEMKLNWSGSALAEAYEVQTSTDKDFKNATKTTTVETSATITVEKQSQHYVRVRPINKGVKASRNFSNVESINFVKKIPLVPPVLREPINDITLFFQGKDTTFWLGWNAVPQASEYLVEMSADPNFADNVLAFKTDKIRYLVKQNVPAGILYWRVKAGGPDRESGWSPVRSMRVFSGRKAEQ